MRGEAGQYPMADRRARTIRRMHANLHQLNKHFGIEDVLRFSAGEGGLWRAQITTDRCTAELYRPGAHVTRWRPAGHDDVLWMSSRARFEYGKPIRGGVPICFPWFGGNTPASDPDGPSHGYARITTWEYLDAGQDDRGVYLTLGTRIDPFDLRYTAVFGDTLSMTLAVTNPGQAPASFESALHSYFSISQIRQARVHGLEHTAYLDTVGGGATPQTQDDKPITFTAETDRTYASDAPVRIEDPGMARAITIEKTGSASTVVWNPWVDKAKAMPDFGDDEWPGMLCVETANAEPNRVVLEPGASHTMTATIGVEAL